MIKSKDIAVLINKAPNTISHLKKTNKKHFEILELGSICKKEGINKEDLKILINMFNHFKKDR